MKHFRRYLLTRCQDEFQREKAYEKENEENKKLIESSTVGVYTLAREANRKIKACFCSGFGEREEGEAGKFESRVD